MTLLEAVAVEGVVRARAKRSKRWIFPAVAAALLVLALLVFPERFLVWLGQTLVVNDPLQRSDIIYVLAGDFYGSRVLAGADLGLKGWAPRVVLSGGPYTAGVYVNRGTGEIAADFAVQHGYPRSLFLAVPMDAPSTVGEAQAMGPVFHRLGAKRIILVTSNFHSRRAEEVFRLFLPEFDFRMEAAPDNSFNPNYWWTLPQQRHLFWTEYQKMIGTLLVRFHLADADLLRRVQE